MSLARMGIHKEKLNTRAGYHNAILADLHGRYVAHVFYAFNNRGIEKSFLSGRCLNQELVDKGHARAV